MPAVVVLIPGRQGAAVTRLAECETPNSGPIGRMVRFLRQYTATSNTRSAKVSAHASAAPRTAS